MKSMYVTLQITCIQIKRTIYIYIIYTHNGKRYKTSLASSALFLHCRCVVALCCFFFKG